MNRLINTNILLFSLIMSAQFSFGQELNFELHSIDLNFPGIAYIKVIDMDGDGDLDIVGGSEHTPYATSRGLAYWRNNGGNPFNWTRFNIDPSFEHIMSVDVAHIDDDDYLDIVGTSWSLNQLVWWKNSGNPTMNWTRKVIKSNFGNAHDANCIDLDRDGDTDIVAANATPGSIIICYNTNPSSPAWTFSTVINGFTSAKSVELVDMDKDGDMDIVGTADYFKRIAWWENKEENSLTWQYRNIDSNINGCSYSHTIDMNHDGNLDVIGTAWISNQVAYWICNELATNSWSKNIVTSTLEIPNKATGCDFDFDGDIDIVVMSQLPGKLVIFENDHFNWTQKTLKDNFQNAAAISVIDLDQDGDADIVAGAGIDGDLIWWENKHFSSTSVMDADNKIVDEFMLHQNYPNPFNNTTTIRFEFSNPSLVSIQIYDIQGKLVRTLSPGQIWSPGSHLVSWNGMDDFGKTVSSGQYFYKINIGGFSELRKMIFLK